MSETPRELFVPNDRAVFMSEKAKVYLCPHCYRNIFSQYEGDEIPTSVECHGLLQGHTLKWDAHVHRT